MYYGSHVQAQERMSQSSYLSSNDSPIHFGLGKEAEVHFEVHWPSGLVETFKADPINCLLILRENTGNLRSTRLR